MNTIAKDVIWTQEITKSTFITYLKNIDNVEDAKNPAMPALHGQSNLLAEFFNEKGDVEKAFADSYLIVEDDFETVDYAGVGCNYRECVKIAKEMRVVDQDTAILYSACIDFLADQALANECRAKLILNKCNKQVQLQCIFNIDADKYQSLLEQVALSDTLPVNRFFAAERLKDEELAHRIFIDLLDSGDVYAAGWAHEKLNESKYDSFDEKSSDFPSKRF